MNTQPAPIQRARKEPLTQIAQDEGLNEEAMRIPNKKPVLVQMKDGYRLLFMGEHVFTERYPHF